ncbi:putative transcriptional regulator YdeE [Alkalibacillus filiformis]|uniref:Transcriptional regulator YdeE n=1 Tax=Alkalibacillus filiformis TaxID=200990 RepID=A0ABU0DTX5_9BACI|nr:GyrI-like domain-containing protein [Alkalibacillus filiformis]MDQ0351886.1 putative transcriptional regulator YdeE [Alkalibacillus filiformis]
MSENKAIKEIDGLKLVGFRVLCSGDQYIITVPPQRYAVMRHKGANYKIRDTYNDLHMWIEDNKYIRLKNKWHLERFYSWHDIENVDIELLNTIK